MSHEVTDTEVKSYSVLVSSNKLLTHSDDSSSGPLLFTAGLREAWCQCGARYPPLPNAATHYKKKLNISVDNMMNICRKNKPKLKDVT